MNLTMTLGRKSLTKEVSQLSVTVWRRVSCANVVVFWITASQNLGNQAPISTLRATTAFEFSGLNQSAILQAHEKKGSNGRGGSTFREKFGYPPPPQGFDLDRPPARARRCEGKRFRKGGRRDVRGQNV